MLTTDPDKPEPQHISRTPSPKLLAELEVAENNRMAANALERRTKWRGLAAVVCVLLVLWFFRWELQVRHGDGAVAYALNRLTGQIHFIRADESMPVLEEKPEK